MEDWAEKNSRCIAVVDWQRKNCKCGMVCVMRIRKATSLEMCLYLTEAVK